MQLSELISFCMAQNIKQNGGIQGMHVGGHEKNKGESYVNNKEDYSTGDRHQEEKDIVCS